MHDRQLVPFIEQPVQGDTQATHTPGVEVTPYPVRHDESQVVPLSVKVAAQELQFASPAAVQEVHDESHNRH
jgi:chromosome condensin MukBEF complex kleisin-like MukF subunit